MELTLRIGMLSLYQLIVRFPGVPWFFLEIILFFLIWIIELLVTSPSHEKLTRSPSVLFWFSGGLVITAPPENKLTSIRSIISLLLSEFWEMTPWPCEGFIKCFDARSSSLFKSITSLSCLMSFNHPFCCVTILPLSALCTIIKQGGEAKWGRSFQTMVDK